MIKMKDFATVSTSTLPERASEVIAAAAIEQLKGIIGMRGQVLIDNVKDQGAKTYVYFTYDDLTAAYDRGEGVDFKYDSASATKSDEDFVEVAKGFKLTWEADHLSKLAVRAAQTKACVTEVRDREDNKLIAKLASGTSSVTAAGVLSGTSADPIKDIREGIRKCQDLGYTPDALLIEHANLEELVSIIGSNEWYNVTEKTILTGGLPVFMGLKVLPTKAANLTHGTSYVFKTGTAGALQLGQAHDVKVHIFDDDDAHCTKVQVYERICPVIARPDASATISGW